MSKTQHISSRTWYEDKAHRDLDRAPDASIVIPVNAQGDLENVLNILQDIRRYQGVNRFEVILVVNNFEPESPPAELEAFEVMGVRVIAIPCVRQSGEAVGFSARIPGIRAATAETCILFDADCRIPDATALLDWYVQQFKAGAGCAFSHVDYYDLREGWSIRTRILIHHTARWFKRNLLGVPTTRGSNYAVHRTTMLALYDDGYLADEMNVGPTFKASGARIAYSGKKELRVLTSGRRFTPGGGIMKLARYFRYRLLYNVRTLPVRKGVAQHTGREEGAARTVGDDVRQ